MTITVWAGKVPTYGYDFLIYLKWMVGRMNK